MAVALMSQIAMVGTIELFAAKALAPGETLHWANSKNLSCPCCKTSPQPPSKCWHKPTRSKKSEQNEEKFCMKLDEQEITALYRVFKPVSLSAFQSALSGTDLQRFVLGRFDPDGASQKIDSAGEAFTRAREQLEGSRFKTGTFDSDLA
jgi:hypothetical protein